MADMRYRPLGSSGLMVSVVGLGCNNFGRRLDLAATRAVVDAALDAGITLLDTADIYGGRGGSESLLGEVLQGRRNEVVLATKFGMDMGDTYGDDFGARCSRRYIRRAVDGSLRRLQTDHIDLYQIHEPDGVTPLAETLGALAELVSDGKILYAGSSNFAAWQVLEAAWLARTHRWPPLISAQNDYSLVATGAETELVPAAQHVGVGILPFFPLANGLLTGKYRRGEPPPGGSRLADRPAARSELALERVERLEAYAGERGRSLLEVAIGGLAARPAVASVIAGATSAEQVVANARAGSWIPDTSDAEALAALTAGW